MSYNHRHHSNSGKPTQISLILNITMKKTPQSSHKNTLQALKRILGITHSGL